ncbi:MAG: sugar phosphate isomerase/epimerase [Planctomycetota bacterium]|nr:sugar phosphate isomerase/epimerase [Planctomycetota bacterium]
MIRLSAFADEISADPIEQLDCLEENGVRFVEFRSILGKNVMDLSESEHREFRDLLESRGFGISAIGSPIGKVAIAEPFEPHRQQFLKAIELASFYGTPNIRVFSYYLPAGDDPALHRDEVLRRMATKAEMARERGLRLVLENERGIYGDTAARNLDIVVSINSTALGLAFDPANFLEVGQPIDEAWAALRDHVTHFHVKDFDPVQKKCVPAGQGAGQIGRLIADAVARGYEGFCTLEPHLLVAAQSHGFTGPVRFGEASSALKAELENYKVLYA